MIRAVEFLVTRGHDLHSILYEYTMDQVTAFYEASLQNYKNGIHDYAFAMRIAQHGKEKDWKEYIQQESKKSKIITSKDRKALKQSQLEGRIPGGLTKGNRKADNNFRRANTRP